MRNLSKLFLNEIINTDASKFHQFPCIEIFACSDNVFFNTNKLLRRVNVRLEGVLSAAMIKVMTGAL
jgi:hypothetical protein